MRFQVTVDHGRVVAALSKRSAKAIEKRANLLGQRSVEEIQKLINNELGSGDGRSGQRGLTSMRSIPFTHQVDSGGDLPVVVSVRALVGGGTAAKFGALEKGSGSHVIRGRPVVAFGAGDAGVGNRRGGVVVKSVVHPGTRAGNFMKRGMEAAVRRMAARFR